MACYNHGAMTLVEITYELQAPLKLAQLRRLGDFANTYGLRHVHVESLPDRLILEYDASRLKETEVAHVLHLAKIPVLRRVEPAN